MFEKKIIEQIAKELLSTDNCCPDDPSCKYAFNIKCTAPKDFLDSRLVAIREKGPPPQKKGEKKTWGWMPIMPSDIDWPCAEIIYLTIVNPD